MRQKLAELKKESTLLYGDFNTALVNESKKRRKEEGKGRKKTHKNKHKTIKKMEKGKYILIITLNINGLNVQIIR